LADKDKVEMEDEIRSKVGDTGKTRVVCRSGNPADPADLEIASLHEARSIIILGPELDNPDSQVIKTALAITNGRNRKKEPYHIVAEIQDPKNMEVARMVGGDELQLVLGGDLISRITVQTCLQSGLSLVYTELLDFGGDEIYFQEEPGLVGKSYGEALLAYEDSALMGICAKDGTVKINPPMDMKIGDGDRVIAISQDDDTVKISGSSKEKDVDVSAFSDAGAGARKPTRVLMLGWNWRGEAIVDGLDDYAATGSEVTIAGPEAHLNGVAVFCERKRKNLKVTHRFCDTEDRAALDALKIADYEHIITLSYSDAMDAQRADACTLVTLLHLRDMAAKSGKAFYHHERDAGRPQPGTRPGDERGRLHRQRQAGGPHALPTLRE
jgi:voltage-gated potassium channel Kch